MAYQKIESASNTLSSSMVDPFHQTINSSLTPAPIPEEIEELLSHLKSKRAVQDEDVIADGGKAAAVLSSPDVSEVMRIFFGEDKKELKEDTKEEMKLLNGFFNEYIKVTKSSNGSKVKEAVMEIAHNPEHIIFRQVVGNEPANWMTVGLPIIETAARKKALIEQIVEDISAVRERRRDLAKKNADIKKELEELKKERLKRAEKTNKDKIRRLTIAMESYKTEADKLELASEKRGSSVTNEEVEDLMKKFVQLQTKNAAFKEEIAQLSANNVLPPNIEAVKKIIAERKAYLKSLQEQISNSLNVSQDGL